MCDTVALNFLLNACTYGELCMYMICTWVRPDTMCGHCTVAVWSFLVVKTVAFRFPHLYNSLVVIKHGHAVHSS